MPDVVDAATRSRMMAGIRATNTKPEILVRKALHRLGFRYGLHCRDVPGKPDLVFRSRHAVIFVHGCFGHGHECPLFRWPSSRRDFWRAKIKGNRTRDIRVLETLAAQGWRVCVVWECALKGPTRISPDKVIERCAMWLVSHRRALEIRGR